jgi:glutamate dehydrogenase/leucine dehydrogenase
MSGVFKNADEFYAIQKELSDRFHAMKPEQEITVRDPEMDVEGYAVIWNTKIAQGGPFDNNGKGMGKGGTRTIPNVTLDDIKMLARGMAEKNAAAGLPMGGSKSGARLDNTDPDYEKKYRRFVRLLKDTGIFYEDGGIFGGLGYDVGCLPPKNAIWACDELKSRRCHTGKPVDLGGTDYDREGIAGLGVAIAGKVLTDSRNIKNPGFAVQGAGAMGAAVIRYFEGTLKAISDPKYGGTWVIDKPSKDLIDALAHQDTDKAKTLLAAQGKNTSPDSSDVLYQDADIVFPCALQDVITDKNAARIKANLICEGANHPTTDDAHEILYKSGVVTIPDIIANVGGIVAAYVELASDKEGAAKIKAAKDFTIKKVAQNAAELIKIVDTYGVRPDKVGDYMAHRNIFFGLKTAENLIL